ncbi:hypothetical protein B0O80DRAFT_247389 [Mortierella sp. GBAus27b]|nr:hypothetical protein B0O80DRAFT_247389 [Mortierella sp. GBAus27b]
MQPAHPLDLLDILSFVVLYVRSRDLPNCLLVSRTWHQAFLPFVWKDIALDKPSEAAVQVHRHLVRRLEVRHHSSHLDTLHLPNLDSISVDCPSQDAVIPFIMRHPTLNCIELTSNIMDIDATFWNTLLGFQHLRELVVCAAEVAGPVSSLWFWQLCTRLERLVLTANNSQVEPYSIPTIEFPRMRNLSLVKFLRNHTRFCVHVMRQCPNLESITWRTIESYPKIIVAELDPLLQASTWPHLEHLDFSRHRFTNKELELLTNRIPRITSLKIHFSVMSSIRNITQLLHPHFAHLRHLSLQHEQVSPTPMAQEFLSSCPSLETLRAPRVHARDAAHGKPWMCLRLKVLHLGYSFDSLTLPDDLQPLVYNQISRLVRLEELRIPVLLGKGLELRLERGLGKLSTLRSLHTVIHGYTLRIMGHPEVDWILEHWKSLRTIKGMREHSDPSIEKAPIERLRDHGIAGYGTATSGTTPLSLMYQQLHGYGCEDDLVAITSALNCHGDLIGVCLNDTLEYWH